VRVLVTGGSSLIGRELVRRLVARGDHVRTFQRRSVPSLVDLGVDERRADITDAVALGNAVRGCDAIVHLAAKVGVVGARDDFQRINVGGTVNVVRAAHDHRVPKIVHVSSPSVAHSGAAIVGAGADAPTVGRSRAWYAETKAQAEIEALDSADDDVGVVAIRPHLVWGPGDTQLVGRIVDRARGGRLALVGGGRALVDTTYIDNAVSALAAAIETVEPGARCSGRAYVIANGEPRPIRELVEGICRAALVDFAPRDIPLSVALRLGSAVDRIWPRLGREDDPPITRFLAEQLGTAHWFDPRPARDELGWKPTVSIDEGLERLADWYRTGA
jgi:nucleoside-diphosphate-sugar epimerase